MKDLWNMLVDLLTKYGVLRILLAILVLFAGWIIAWILRELTFKCVRKCRIGERLRVCMSDEAAAPAMRAERIAGRIVFWTHGSSYSIYPNLNVLYFTRKSFLVCTFPISPGKV